MPPRKKRYPRYPPLFVANLENVNDCVTREIENVIFDAADNDVAYAGGESASSRPSFGKGVCTGQGMRSAAPESASWESGTGGSGTGSGDDGMWHGGQEQQQQSPPPPQPQPQNIGSTPTPQRPQNVEPSSQVDKELQAYLDMLYGKHRAQRINKRHRLSIRDPKTTTKCTTITNDVETCTKPSRWVKQAACSYTCARKGRATKIPANIEGIEERLLALEKNLTELMDKIRERSRKVLVEKRRAGARANATREIEEVVVGVATADSSLDAFLIYLERLESKVIECIRYVAASTSLDNTAALERRQLVDPVPSLSAYEHALDDAIATTVKEWLDVLGPVVKAAASDLAGHYEEFPGSVIDDVVDK
jgi:hypothetical protein